MMKIWLATIRCAIIYQGPMGEAVADEDYTAACQKGLTSKKNEAILKSGEEGA